MQLIPILVALFSTTAVAVLNGPCHNNRVPGTCITTANCAAGGGTSQAGNCPGDPADVRCCSKPVCNTGSCQWTPSCSGTSTAGLCPGPTNFKCCSAQGTWPRPGVSGSSGCKVTGQASRILDTWPGDIKVVYCFADKPNSDHNQGLALDLMVYDYNPYGWQIAEWAMNNRVAYKITYVIWGQRIWSVSVDGAPKSWNDWRTMADRGSITANHWDHVHISFSAGL